MSASIPAIFKLAVAGVLCALLLLAHTGRAANDDSAYSDAELDQMLAPIALYPDSMLSQILMAATYPMEVVLAARWSRANPDLKGESAVRAVEQEQWDPSVKSMVAFPQVLEMMDQKLEWTQRLGDAFLGQQEQVMAAVQGLRSKAYAEGNLKSNDYVRVVPKEENIIVDYANPRVIYVPYYDPWAVYGAWWWPAYPPVYWGPWPDYHASPGVSVSFWWGSGIRVGAGFFFGGFLWPHHHVAIINTRSFYYRPRPPIAGLPHRHWAHDPGHRRGVPYHHAHVRERFRDRDDRHDGSRDIRSRHERSDRERPYRDRDAPDVRQDFGNHDDTLKPERPGRSGASRGERDVDRRRAREHERNRSRESTRFESQESASPPVPERSRAERRRTNRQDRDAVMPRRSQRAQEAPRDERQRNRVERSDRRVEQTVRERPSREAEWRDRGRGDRSRGGRDESGRHRRER